MKSEIHQNLQDRESLSLQFFLASCNHMILFAQKRLSRTLCHLRTESDPSDFNISLNLSLYLYICIADLFQFRLCDRMWLIQKYSLRMYFCIDHILFLCYSLLYNILFVFLCFFFYKRRSKRVGGSLDGKSSPLPIDICNDRDLVVALPAA